MRTTDTLGRADAPELEGAGAQGAYAMIAAISEEVTRSPATFTGLIATEPRRVSGDRWDHLLRRYERVVAWQRAALAAFAASVRGEAPPGLAKAVLDHLPGAFGWEHHRSLALERIAPPVFFRTDESGDGALLEVQCPGSLWGVHEILAEYYRDEGGHDTVPLSRAFASSLTQHLGAAPLVHHLLDNSSHPAGERFFIQRARRSARYFGFDVGVRPQDCNFVRAHDCFGLLIDNFASERLERLTAGEPIYDLPPIALFDQKIVMALPFWRLTRSHFDDAMRALFPYTNVVEPDRVELEDEVALTFARFAARSRRERGYFLKYAGADVSRNWGSRAVFHLGKLSAAACEARLRAATERYAVGERWILQHEAASEEQVRYLDRGGGVETTIAHAKHSVFHGPGGPIGALSMFERFYKVHGSSDTITTITIPPEHVLQ